MMCDKFSMLCVHACVVQGFCTRCKENPNTASQGKFKKRKIRNGLSVVSDGYIWHFADTSQASYYKVSHITRKKKKHFYINIYVMEIGNLH